MSRSVDKNPATRTMRREPVQARSQQRVELLLDTTANLVDAVGIEGVTTGLLSERAGVSIGSVYRFFPDRISLIRALSDRNFERYVDRFGDARENAHVDNWKDAVKVAIDQFVSMHETEPGFRALRFGGVIDEQLLDGTTRSSGSVLDPFRELLVDQLGVQDTGLLTRQIGVAAEICDGLLTRAFLRDKKGDEWLIHECRTVVCDYLDQRLQLA
ncbi:MAG: TetR/AcrR family transcriptional regulator [Solirubrobacterales bacterium]